MRYRFYREHKYLIFVLFELERVIAKTDFRINEAVLKIKAQLQSLADLMKEHARHEEEAIHALLKQKGSTVYTKVEKDHQSHNEQYTSLQQKLDAIVVADHANKLSLGYAFYLSYRLLLIDNLQHFHEEETVIMPALQQLYSDDELKSVDRHVYQEMTAEDMMAMMEVLSPHMDPSDTEFFLKDIKDAEPEKFASITL
jgi:hemerythrin-like domain-containing protein